MQNREMLKKIIINYLPTAALVAPTAVSFKVSAKFSNNLKFSLLFMPFPPATILNINYKHL